MSKTLNTFVYYDLNTTDKSGAAAFYGGLFGWTVDERESGHTSLANNGQGFGGLDEARGGAPAHWIGYVQVDDLDQRLEKLTRMGGKALMPAMDIPNVGRIVALTDPSGAAFALYQGAEHMGDWEPSREKVGDIGWAEITANDLQQSKAFYGEGFGWKVAQSMQMPNGEYAMLQSGDLTFGGMFEKPAQMPVCAWTFYVNVTDVDQINAKAKELGGNVLFTDSVPGMVKFSMIQDPQGAIIGVAQDISGR